MSGAVRFQALQKRDLSISIELDEYRTSWDVFGITTDGGTIYLAGGLSGLQVITNTARVDTAVFSDGFESGDTSAWSQVVP